MSKRLEDFKRRLIDAFDATQGMDEKEVLEAALEVADEWRARLYELEDEAE